MLLASAAAILGFRPCRSHDHIFLTTLTMIIFLPHDVLSTDDIQQGSKVLLALSSTVTSGFWSHWDS
jgi:hypothetical protein